MRKQYFYWMTAVFGIFGTVYGGYLLIYHFNHGNGLNVLALVLLILGVVALSFYIILYISVAMAKKKAEDNKVIDVKLEEKKEEVVETPKEEVKEEKPVEKKPQTKKDDVVYEAPRERREYTSSSSYSYSTVYVKQVGYEPVLRVTGPQIVDMRNNTYYRLENNMVMQDGYGPVFEIRGNQIRSAFGGYLYELSGSNINKVFGGFYASISGNYITLFDLSQKYEMSDSLSKKQILAVAALLFGQY